MKRFVLVIKLALVLFAALTMAVTMTTKSYCVIPSNATQFNFSPQCNISNSYVLSHYVEKSFEYFKSDNSRFYFCPGKHILHPTNSSVIQIANISNLSLIGSCCDGNCTENVSWTVECENNTGFLFKNICNLHLENLSFHGCGQSVPLLNPYGSTTHKIGLALQNVTSLTMHTVTTYKSVGFGLYGENIIGYCLLERSNFISSLGTPTGSGNAAFTFKECEGRNTSLSITASSFLDGNNTSKSARATGLSLIIECDNVGVIMNKVILRNNIGNIGGNLAITIKLRKKNLINVSVKVINCCIESGQAFRGGGIYVNIGKTIPSKHVKYTLIEINSTHFLNNHIKGFGGGLYIEHLEEAHWPLNNATIVVMIFNCSFIENKLTPRYHTGIAAHVSNFVLLGITQSSRPQFQTHFKDCQFLNNTRFLNNKNETNSPAAAILIEDDPYVTIDNCNFTYNECTGLTAINSNLEFRGNIKFLGNHGVNGGGLLVCEGSFVYLDESTQVNFTENSATIHGGGIYIEEKCQQSKPICFYQFSNYSDGYDNSDSKKLPKIYLDHNKADKAGNAIFGGSVSDCYLLHSSHSHMTNNSMEIFNKTFHIKPNYPDDLTAVSSYPVGICFCNETDLKPNCSLRNQNETLYPGKQFQLYLVVVGQMSNSNFSYGTVQGKFRTSLDHTPITVDSVSCTEHSFTVNNTTVHFVLEAQNAVFTTPEEIELQRLHIPIHQLPCPPGFTLRNKSCKCLRLLDNNNNNNITCDPKIGVIKKRKSQTYRQPWIGVYCTNTCSGIMYAEHCPFDYCNTTSDTKIDVSDVSLNSCICNHTRVPKLCNNCSYDEQCANNRTGILCSECKKNYSLILGSSKCWHCGNGTLGLLIVFGIAGIVLVFFLTLFNLTVTKGTINGLIFYANIIHINAAAFVVYEGNRPHSYAYRRYYSFLFAAISWFNLDLGIETCFFDGMDAYWKSGLQFVFPIYLCIIAGLVIVLSNRYAAVARLFGNNAVKILATLFVLTHAKIQRAIMNALSFVTITLAGDDKEVLRIVWVLEAKTMYLEGKHRYLFAIAMVISVPVLFFIFILLFVQLLQKQSHRRILFWVNRLKPLLDAFTGPYKDRYSFWIGYLILIRTLLFCGYAVNLFRDPNINLILAVFACFILLATALSLNGVYRHWPLNVLESFYFLNLGSVCMGVAYIRQADIKEKHLLEIVTLSISSVLAVFIGTLVYHMNKQIRFSNIIRKANNCITKIRVRKRQLEDEDNLPPLRGECSEENRPLIHMHSSSSSSSDIPSQ